MAYEGESQALAAQGKMSDAVDKLDRALTIARANQKRGHEAMILLSLGELALQSGDRQGAMNSLEQAGQIAKRYNFYRTEGQAMIDLAEQASSLGPVTELEQKVAANPLDHQASFDLATALNAAGKRTEATQQLLEIVKRDRKWNEDGARKQLVQFFDAWGATDEATVEGRKRLSTILFS